MSQDQEQKYLSELIENKERELLNIRIQCWIYTKEAVKPANITKAQAEENLAIYQKQEKYLEQHLEVYKQYGLEHGFKL